MGGNFAIATAGGFQLAPALAYSQDSDRYLVVWQDYRNDPPSRVYGQFVSGNGNLIGANFLLSDISNATASQYSPFVAYNSVSREFLVVWADERDLASTGTNIYGRRLSAAGSLQGFDFAISSAPWDPVKPRADCNSQANECLVVWADTRTSWVSGSDIWAQRVAGDGSLLGQDLRISAAPDYQGRPAVASSSSPGRFLVVWFDGPAPDTGYDIAGQVVESGALLGGKFIISSAPGDKLRPQVAYNSRDREFVVVWYDLRSGAKEEIYEQRVSDDGLLLEGNALFAQGPGDQLDPTLAYDPAANGYRAVWYDGDRTYANPVASLFSRLATSSGAPTGDITNISNSARMPVGPEIAYGSLSREYLTVWEDGRSYDSLGVEIYGQRLGTSPGRFVNMLPILMKNWRGP
ncbi:MAG: hypothetical protein Q8P59_14965 [Dehalococcoidia bacterium]|nr:hypothetical protein [Dehalococcoidia bacterium]